MRTPEEMLAFALEKYPERVEVVPLEALVADSGRENARRPAYLRLNVPDAVVKSLRGRREDSDLLLLVQVPREVAERSESRLILPGEVR